MSFQRLIEIRAMGACFNLSTPDDVEGDFSVMWINAAEVPLLLFMQNLRWVVTDPLLLFDAIVGHGAQVDLRSLVQSLLDG